MDISEARALAARAQTEPLLGREDLRQAVIVLDSHLRAAEHRMTLAGGILKKQFSVNSVHNPSTEESYVGWFPKERDE